MHDGCSPLMIISGLWAFSLLAGGQPSVLRSAVMFTCIVLGQNFARKTSIYNTLAFSAFILLCYNPYWLWDVGVPAFVLRRTEHYYFYEAGL
ncbi:MAG: ComEC/Rec2 family competence protein [Bacteroidota bacterium]